MTTEYNAKPTGEGSSLESTASRLSKVYQGLKYLSPLRYPKTWILATAIVGVLGYHGFQEMKKHINAKILAGVGQEITRILSDDSAKTSNASPKPTYSQRVTQTAHELEALLSVSYFNEEIRNNAKKQAAKSLGANPKDETEVNEKWTQVMQEHEKNIPAEKLKTLHQYQAATEPIYESSRNIDRLILESLLHLDGAAYDFHVQAAPDGQNRVVLTIGERRYYLYKDGRIIKFREPTDLDMLSAMFNALQGQTTDFKPITTYHVEKVRGRFQGATTVNNIKAGDGYRESLYLFGFIKTDTRECAGAGPIRPKQELPILIDAQKFDELFGPIEQAAKASVTIPCNEAESLEAILHQCMISGIETNPNLKVQVVLPDSEGYGVLTSTFVNEDKTVTSVTEKLAFKGMPVKLGNQKTVAYAAFENGIVATAVDDTPQNLDTNRSLPATSNDSLNADMHRLEKFQTEFDQRFQQVRQRNAQILANSAELLLRSFWDTYLSVNNASNDYLVGLAEDKVLAHARTALVGVDPIRGFDPMRAAIYKERVEPLIQEHASRWRENHDTWTREQREHNYAEFLEAWQSLKSDLGDVFDFETNAANMARSNDLRYFILPILQEKIQARLQALEALSQGNERRAVEIINGFNETVGYTKEFDYAWHRSTRGAVDAELNLDTMRLTFDDIKRDQQLKREEQDFLEGVFTRIEQHNNFTDATRDLSARFAVPPDIAHDIVVVNSLGSGVPITQQQTYEAADAMYKQRYGKAPVAESDIRLRNAIADALSSVQTKQPFEFTTPNQCPLVPFSLDQLIQQEGRENFLPSFEITDPWSLPPAKRVTAQEANQNPDLVRKANKEYFEWKGSEEMIQPDSPTFEPDRDAWDRFYREAERNGK